MRWAAALSLFLTLVGCARSDSARVTADTQASEVANKGVIVVGLALGTYVPNDKQIRPVNPQGGQYTSVALHFRRLSAEGARFEKESVRSEVGMRCNWTVKDCSLSRINYIVSSFIPGEYVLTDYNTFLYSYPRSTNTTTSLIGLDTGLGLFGTAKDVARDPDLSKLGALKWKLEPGKVVYIGNFVINPSAPVIKFRPIPADPAAARAAVAATKIDWPVELIRPEITKARADQLPSAQTRETQEPSTQQSPEQPPASEKPAP